jgi:hypothetical protein
MLAVLPHGLGDDKRGILRYRPENMESHLLTVDEAVALRFIEGMRSLDVETFAFNCSDQSFFHRGLRRLTFLVRGQTKIAVGDKVDCIHKSKLLAELRQQAAATVMIAPGSRYRPV